MQLKEFAEFISTLAAKSGEIIKPYLAKADLAIEIKEDQTLVTQADRQAEAVMRDLIRKKYPEHGILGEEFGPENTSAEFVWTLDPIDGTFSFARGCPLFGTLIGLLQGGKPVLGAINHPVLNPLCIGNNAETTINGRNVRLREVHLLSEAMLLTTDLANVGDHRRNGFDELLKRVRLYRTWGDCYGYLLVASGCLGRSGHHARPHDESMGYPAVNSRDPGRQRHDYNMVWN